MNGDPNTVREDVLGALSLVEATCAGMPDGHDKLRLAMAISALNRSLEKLDACPVCSGFGCDMCPPDNVVQLHPYSMKVGDA